MGFLSGLGGTCFVAVASILRGCKRELGDGEQRCSKLVVIIFRSQFSQRWLLAEVVKLFRHPTAACERTNGLAYVAVRLDVGSLQGDGDAVQEDEDQDHVVKQLVRDETLAPVPEPERTRENSVSAPRGCVHNSLQSVNVHVCVCVCARLTGSLERTGTWSSPRVLYTSGASGYGAPSWSSGTECSVEDGDEG